MDAGRWKVTIRHQVSNLKGIVTVIPGFTPMNGIHIERMTQNEIYSYLLVKVSHPVPAEHGFNT